MPRYDVFDEAVIDADLDTVYATMMLEFSGNRGWWRQRWESRPRGAQPITQPGGSIDITVHDIVDARFAARTVELVEKERLDIEFFAGDFIGTATWRWTAEGGKTRVSQHWRASPNSVKLKLLGVFADIAKIHSSVIQDGLAALARHLSEARQQ